MIVADRLSNLQELLHGEVPLSRHMGVAADSYDGENLVLTAQLEPNINIHGTAFGGSLYALAALAGWALLRLRLEDRGLRAEIVLGSARIDYHKPVRSSLVARAGCDAGGFDAFAARVEADRRASLSVTVDLGDTRRAESAVFSGSYANI